MAKELESTDKRIGLVSAKIKSLRLQAGYTSAQRFAYDKELDRVQYWRVESGTTNITLKTLLKILDIHNISLGDFFSGI